MAKWNIGDKVWAVVVWKGRHVSSDYTIENLVLDEDYRSEWIGEKIHDKDHRLILMVENMFKTEDEAKQRLIYLTLTNT